ncbi:MAG: TIGR00282 family metallophosphoesterase [Fimbriimonadales bacterium]|nr:TIGR00282 family metallophosphoesterase [Fimbriimonadales bacterium]
MRVLFLGDIVGKAGRRAVANCLPSLVDTYSPDFVIANGENAAAGIGITPEIVSEFLKIGIDAITLGNHAFNRREIESTLESEPRLIRPANFPKGTAGRGLTVIEKSGMRLGLINLCGRVFMSEYDDPFRLLDELIDQVDTPAIIVDFHAEATSEKSAFAWYADGRVSAVLGTHTHVQTADERILPEGTAFISDVGMCGPMDSVIGMDRDVILRRFLTLMPERFEVASGRSVICGVVLDVKVDTGRTESIERVQWRDVT